MHASRCLVSGTSTAIGISLPRIAQTCLHPGLQIRYALLRQRGRLLVAPGSSISICTLLCQLLPLQRCGSGLHSESEVSQHRARSTTKVDYYSPQRERSSRRAVLPTSSCTAAHLLQHLGGVLVPLLQRRQQACILGLHAGRHNTGGARRM